MDILIGGAQYIDSCLAIARVLPQYFSELAFPIMSRDFREYRLYVAVDSNEVVGFISIQSKNSQVVEILWMAVKPGYQRQGVGTLLMNQIVADLKAEGVRLLEVKTLAATVDYAPYVPTRQFYENKGFVHLETIDPYPEWQPGNACAIYVKVL